ncbi:MAG: FMN-binding protein [Clostridia bacterium]|nr:FMN-binding protein [Clostridia bacterium]
MKNKSLKEILVPAIMLFVIATICTALLAGTNLLTEDRIDELEIQAAMAAKTAVFADATNFSDEKTVDVNGETYTYYEAQGEKGNITGYVFSVTVKSYGGDLSAMVGISAETDKITGVEITSINDTPGLGMKVNTENFLSQYIERTGIIGVNKNEKTDTEIQAVSGATISSKAVTDAVNQSFSAYESIKAGGNNG